MGLSFHRFARLPITACIVSAALWTVPTSPWAQTASATGPVNDESRGNSALAAAGSPNLNLEQLAEAARTTPGGDQRPSQPPLPEERSTWRTTGSIAAALLLVTLAAAGITLTIRGLRDDMRRRRRGYRRRSRRTDNRSQSGNGT